MSISVTFPFALSTGSVGYFESTNEIVDALRSDVHSLVATNWGERVMHTDFGCNLRQFLFESKTVSLKRAIHDRVKSQLSRWLPFINLVGMFVRFSEDDPSVPDPGMQIDMQMTYGNIPVNLLLTFPSS